MIENKLSEWLISLLALRNPQLEIRLKENEILRQSSHKRCASIAKHDVRFQNGITNNYGKNYITLYAIVFRIERSELKIKIKVITCAHVILDEVAYRDRKRN